MACAWSAPQEPVSQVVNRIVGLSSYRCGAAPSQGLPDQLLQVLGVVEWRHWPRHSAGAFCGKAGASVEWRGSARTARYKLLLLLLLSTGCVRRDVIPGMWCCSLLGNVGRPARLLTSWCHSHRSLSSTNTRVPSQSQAASKPGVGKAGQGPIARLGLQHVKHIIAISSAKGGVGKSTTAGRSRNAPSRTGLKCHRACP